MNGDGRLQFRQYWKGTGENDLIAYAGYEYDGYERLNKIDAMNAGEDQLFEFRRTYDANVIWGHHTDFRVDRVVGMR